MDRPRRLIRVTEAMRRLPYARSRFYELVKANRLPPLVRLSGLRASFMDEAALDLIITEMIEGDGNHTKRERK